MALARRMRHNSDASRSTSSRSTSPRRDDSRFECLIVFDVFQGATTTVSAVNQSIRAELHFAAIAVCQLRFFGPVLSIRLDRNEVIRSQVGRRPWKRRPPNRRSYQPDLE